MCSIACVWRGMAGNLGDKHNIFLWRLLSLTSPEGMAGVTWKTDGKLIFMCPSHFAGLALGRQEEKAGSDQYCL